MLVIMMLTVLVGLSITPSQAHDDGRYANSPLKYGSKAFIARVAAHAAPTQTGSHSPTSIGTPRTGTTACTFGASG